MKELFEYIQQNKPVALLAPSFVVDFEYPEIIQILKALGFGEVVELTYAAKLINNTYHQHFKDNIGHTRICSNCPTTVQYIKSKFPQHKDKLMPIASPMVIMSRFIKKEHGSTTKTLFIGPCLAKKIEAKTSGDVDEAITFKELQALREYAQTQGVHIDTNKSYDFDDYYNNYTKIYPLAGSVAQTFGYKDILKYNQIIACDGIGEIDKAIKEMENNPDIKFIDPLACIGGCCGGPGVITKEPIPVREAKVKKYQEESKKKTIPGAHLGKLKYAEGLNYTNTFI